MAHICGRYIGIDLMKKRIRPAPPPRGDLSAQPAAARPRRAVHRRSVTGCACSARTGFGATAPSRRALPDHGHPSLWTAPRPCPESARPRPGNGRRARPGRAGRGAWAAPLLRPRRTGASRLHGTVQSLCAGSERRPEPPSRHPDGCSARQAGGERPRWPGVSAASARPRTAFGRTGSAAGDRASCRRSKSSDRPWIRPSTVPRA